MRKKNRWLWWLVLLVVVITAINMNDTGAPASSTPTPTRRPAAMATRSPIFSLRNTPTQSATAKPTATVKPTATPKATPGLSTVPAKYARNVFFVNRGAGDSKVLKGNIALTVFFVDDSDSTWNTAAMSTFKAQQATATNQLYKDASPYGVSLNVTIRYEKVKINGTFTINDSYPWVESALKAAGYSDPANVIPTLKSKYNADEAAIMFAVNRVGRSFAWQSTTARGIEYTILHTDQADYRHELYHIFGARDLYTPESVMNIAKEHFTDSVMLTGGTLPMDDLNAYLIGWTDTLSSKAKAFLDDTAWITPEYIADEAAKETFTGYGTRRFGSGTYTGDMVSGFPHGKGKIVWDSGDTYEGDWVNGEGHGYGTMRWANGVTYTGQFYKWRLHGYGTCTFADGTKQTGQWDNDKFIG